MEKTPDAIIIGAGVIGCSIAFYLAKRGIKVIILERNSTGSGASGHATGSLGVLGAEFTPGPSFQMAIMGYKEFINLVPELEQMTEMDLLYQRLPSLRIALDESEERLIKNFMTWQRDHVDVNWINSDEVAQLEPRLTSNVRGAALEPESAQIDSYRLNLALERAAVTLGGQVLTRNVTGLITEGNVIKGVRTTKDELYSPNIIVAAGSQSAQFAKTLNFPIPVKPLKGERLILKYSGRPLPVLISSPKRGHMISRKDGFLSVGSTGGRDYDSTERFLINESEYAPTEAAKIELLQRAIDVFPDLENAELVQQLAGSRPLSVDRMPIIGPIPGWDGIMLATGHTTKGIHLGPITGRIIAEYILDGKPNIPVDTSIFLPARFKGDYDTDFNLSSKEVEE